MKKIKTEHKEEQNDIGKLLETILEYFELTQHRLSWIELQQKRNNNQVYWIVCMMFTVAIGLAKTTLSMIGYLMMASLLLLCYFINERRYMEEANKILKRMC